jgi:hypothetical protein
MQEQSPHFSADLPADLGVHRAHPRNVERNVAADLHAIIAIRHEPAGRYVPDLDLYTVEIVAKAGRAFDLQPLGAAVREFRRIVVVRQNRFAICGHGFVYHGRCEGPVKARGQTASLW